MRISRRDPAQHRGALRPVERPVRDVPRRDHDATPRRCSTPTRHVATTSASTRPSCARSTRVLDAAASERAPGCGDRHRLGRACASGPPSAAPPVTSLTLSVEQQRSGRKRVRGPGSDDRVDILLQDYREVEGEYDAVVSVEMIEAVGDEYWPTYFKTLDRLLVPGGSGRGAGDHHAARGGMLVTRRRSPGSRSTSSPGGSSPRSRPSRRTAEHAGLRVTAPIDYGATTPRPCAAGAHASLPHWGTRRTWGSTPPSVGSGSSTSPTARPASPGLPRRRAVPVFSRREVALRFEALYWTFRDLTGADF